MTSRCRSCSTEGIIRKSVKVRSPVLLQENGFPFELRLTMASDNDQPRVPVPDYRPVERFWPYVDLPEQPSDEELAALDPELSEALFGTPKLPFSVTLEF